MEMPKKPKKPKPGPKPETFKIEGMNWEDAVKKALQVKPVRKKTAKK